MYSKTSRQPRLLGEGEIKAIWDHSCTLYIMLKAKGSEHSYCDQCSALFYAVSDNESGHALQIYTTVKTKEQKPRYVDLRNYTITGMFTGWRLASSFTSEDKGKPMPFEITLTNGKDEFVMSGFVFRNLSLRGIARTEPEKASGK